MEDFDGLLPESFELLLAALHPDREQAGSEYELLRGKLIYFFRFNRCHKAEECADDTLNRTARRLAGGTQIEKIPAYAHGVARNVLREYYGKPENHPEEIDPALPSPENLLNWILSAEESACVKQCLQKLAPADARLFVQYFLHDETSNPNARQAQAQELGISSTALRLRIFRIRGRLEACCHECLAARRKKR